MGTYVFRYRRVGSWFWKKMTIVGHSFQQNIDGSILSTNKMVIYFADGSLQEIADWDRCEMRLGSDWFKLTQKAMERGAGQAIPTNVAT